MFRKPKPPQSPPRKVTRDGRVMLVAGASGSGKTAWVVQQVATAPRLLVWDSLGQWAREFGCRKVTDFAELGRAVLPASMPERVAFYCPPTPERFETFCKIAWVYIRAHGAPLVIEELSDVTHPGKAPLAWGEIVRKSRHFGAEVYALTQRPAESDKTVVGNAALIHCGLMAFPNDRKYMAQALDVDVGQVADLGQLEWIERDMRTRELRSGRLAFKKSRR